LQRSQAELDASGVQILAISTDNLDGPAALAAAQGYEFPILFSALDPSIPKKYGVSTCSATDSLQPRFS